MVRGREAFRVGRVLGRSFGIWLRNLLPFTILSVIVYLPLLAYGVLAFPRPRQPATLAELVETFIPYAMILSFGWCLLWFIAPLAVIHGVLQQLRGEPASFLGCLRVYLTRVFPALGVGVLVGLIAFFCTIAASFVAGLLSAMGLPGAVLTILTLLGVLLVCCMFWMAVPVAAIERPGLLASLRRSMELTRGSRGRLLAIVLVGVAMQAAPSLLPGLTRGGPIAGWITLFLFVALGTYAAVATSVAYHDLRAAKEGVGIEELVRVFA